MRPSLIAAGLMVLTGAAMAQDAPVLTVLTYDSFVPEWGAGPLVEAAFEETCGCDLRFVAAGDGAALLARLQLEGTRTDVDVVLGLDTNLIDRASATGMFSGHGLTGIDFALPVDWDDPVFLPYDWGSFAFIHDTAQITDAPGSLAELAASDLKIVIQDPRSSTPGLGLLLWVKMAYGDQAGQVWADLSDNILTVTKGWSEAYGMFLDGEADMVLSYTTSPSYHLIAEGDETKKAAPFDEGHYMQIEVAAKLAATDQAELADEFMQFIVSDRFQSIIPTTNWMFPAVTPDAGLPDGFAKPQMAGASLIFTPAQAAEIRDEALSEWLTVLSQ